MQSSTLRSAANETFTPSGGVVASVQRLDTQISEALESGQADLVVVLEEHPSLLRNKSVLMEMVFREYTSRRRTLRDLDLESHCRRFEQFGNSIQRSIQRELEVLRFLDVHGDPPDWPKADDEFGRFRVMEELGFGGSSRVYLCLEDEVGNRPVVVKATRLPNFEASILGKLNHENITPIYSTGFIEDRELSYLCMPYLGRSTLADLIDMAFQDGCPRKDTAVALAANRWTADDRWQPRTVRKRRFWGDHLGTYVGAVLGVSRQIADALEHAHNQNIVHGDLKPSNVLLTPEGKPLLLDFNLSQDFSSDSSLRGGTLPYMPPEHLQAIAGKATAIDNTDSDVRSDIYSFGALLYELLAGVTPHREVGPAEDPSAMAELLLADILQGTQSIRKRNRFVSTRLDSLVLRCLDYDKAKRPASMSEVRQALQNERRAWGWAYRQARIRPAMFSLAVAIPLAVGSGLATYIAMQPPRYLASYEDGMRLAEAGDVDAATLHFMEAVRSNPSFDSARLQLGRVLIAKGEFDLAINEFYLIARNDQDLLSMEYMGYCFNRKDSSVAAIPWYEKVLKKGGNSAHLLNNLGASYLEARSTLSRKDSLERSGQLLFAALKAAPTSATVQLNIVRLALAKSDSDASYDPFMVWSQAQSLLANAPTDPSVEALVAEWFDKVRNYELEKREFRSDTSPPPKALTARKQFEAVYARVSSGDSNGKPVFSRRSERSATERRRFFIDPSSTP